MIFTINEKKYEVEIVRKNNKNTYIRIKDNHIYITTSYFTTKKSIIKLLEQNKKSIAKMIERVEKKQKRKESFYLLGIPYQIIIDNTVPFSINKDNHTITVKNEEELDKYLRKQAKDIYSNHLNYYYNKFKENIPYPSLKIRKMTSRWGVCNTKTHNITLNLELMHYDVDCLDYVIVHELSHLIEANHSQLFWQVVSKYYPNYKSIRKKLRD